MVRIPSAQRRAMMISEGIEIVRNEGGSAVTLTRVAEASGVSKPIAYRLFDSLEDLLRKMEERILDAYETALLSDLVRARTRGATDEELLEIVARSYVNYGLNEGSVYDTILAARISHKAETRMFDLDASILPLLAECTGAREEALAPLVAMFVGAADYLVAAVQAGRFTEYEAVQHLITLFSPQVAALAGACGSDATDTMPTAITSDTSNHPNTTGVR